MKILPGKMSALMTILVAATALGIAQAQMLTPSAPAAAGISNAQLQRIKQIENQYVEENQIAGGTILVARNGKLVMFDTFGNIDKEAGKAMPKDAIFRLNSMTKPIITV